MPTRRTAEPAPECDGPCVFCEFKQNSNRTNAVLMLMFALFAATLLVGLTALGVIQLP
jgi:hypothetical protein